jgi:hypothetical protein
MPDEQIELECPSCDQVLELDIGFAGGVCRCSDCGALMTVPEPEADAGTEMGTDRADAPGGGRAETPGRAAAPPSAAATDEPTPLRGEQLERVGDGEFRTTSGRAIQIDERRIPTAQRKRAVIRATTAILFFAVILALLAIGSGVLIWLITSETGDDSTTEWVADRGFDYDASANPFLIEQPNVLGVPLSPRTAVIVDASAESSEWLGLVGEALAVGLGERSGLRQVTLVYATADGPEALRGGMRAASAVQADDVRDFVGEQSAVGQPQLGLAAEGVAEREPDALILVTGRAVDDAEVTRMENALSGVVQRVDIVSIDRAANEALRSWAEDRVGGRAVEVAGTRSMFGNSLGQWREDAAGP